MSDIATRLSSLCLDENLVLKRKVQGYFLRLKNSKDYFLLKRQKICIRDIPNKSYLILERKVSPEGNVCVICPMCMNFNAIDSVSSLEEDTFKNIKKQSCEHALVSYLLWENTDLVNDDIYDPTVDIVEVLPVEKDYVAVIHPSNTHKKKVSAPVRLSNRMVSPKCCLCKGGDMCIHIRIHKAHFEKQEENNASNENTRTTRSNPNEEDIEVFNEQDNEQIRVQPKTRKDPGSKCEQENNPFGIKINFPLSEDDQEKFWNDVV